MPVIVPGDGGGPAPTPDEPRYATSELIEETLQELSGHTTDVGQVTYLGESISESTTTFRVAEQGQVSRGVAEIGTELVYVATAVDGTVTLLPTGRGWGSSRPSAWAEGTLVTFQPRFPRHTILQRINDVIGNLWPSLYGLGQTEFAFQPVVQAFSMPADTEDVTNVLYDEVGPQKAWVPITQWRFNRNAAPSEFPTGRSIILPPHLTPGRTVRVRYMKRPSQIQSEGEFTDSGLEISAWPAVMYGALHRMVASLPLGTAGVQSAEAREWSRTRPIDINQLAEYFRGLHELEVEKERRRLQDANPITINYTR
ncbi:hypothetical protein [Jiangella anatolica]|uniref:Uncharacterized protein n=1 Tax=Jiangella anatolica TaxID=2670374 RepID=A0A2W2CVA6_9ACTN|nr:hypothetical protein [Jiangella anatolica]PZF84153.1 hypothetical protein C1I92_09900 [Jiangella anatolica]